MKSIITIIACLPLFSTVSASTTHLIPAPAKITLPEQKSSHFQLTNNTIIVAPSSLTNEVKALVRALKPATGFSLKTQTKSSNSPQIKLTLDPSLKDLGKEGYSLQVSPKGVIIKAPTSTGVFYGIQSLVQLLPAEIVSTSTQQQKWEIPCIKISDKPRFSWRAFMLDESRHFKGQKEVEKLLDQMADLKMNVFHWHLTDDQGWRIEIKKYPKLTSIGSIRKATNNNKNPHSGFYTQEEIKEIVKYAAERHITIIPEIGMPGHATAAIASYPELGTTKKKVEVWTRFGKAYDTYDPSSETTYRMLGDVLEEVFTLFPSKIVHIGGDEVRFDHWKESKSVQDLMKREGLKTMADVQLYFTNRIAEIVQSKGRNIMGWNEIVGDDLHGFLQGGQTASAAKLDKDTVVHFWKGSAELAKKAIKNGHTIVNSWHSYTYLDYGYGKISLSKAYNFDPILPGLTPEEEKRIIGSGCQMWSEWIPTVKRLEYQVYPRIAAYAETGWTQKENKDFESFKDRMQKQLKRWDIQGIQYASGETNRLTASDLNNYITIDQWTPKSTPAKWTEVTFSTNNRITSAGTYEVAFLYKKGTHALDINSVTLLENGKPIDTDKHTAFSGSRLARVIYKLKLSKFKPGAKYTLKADIKGNAGTDSNGEVKILLAE